jgi:hypothetical protein
MADNQPALKVDHLFAHIGAMVGDALNALGHAHEPKRKSHGQVPSGHLFLRIHHNLFLESIHRVIKEEDLASKVCIVTE